MTRLAIDLSNEVLWRDEERILLSRKAFAVLRCLVENRGQLVTREKLLTTVWPSSYVTEDSLRHYILELRKALGEAGGITTIETIRGRGYCLIADIALIQGFAATAPALPTPETQAVESAAAVLLGRTDELRELAGWFAQAQAGSRQIGFISGEPGIGKTALVGAFLDGLAQQQQVISVRGYCSQLYSAQEPLMPVVDALEELCARPGQGSFLEALRVYAPTWFAMLPKPDLPTKGSDPEPARRNGYREGMLRELAHFLEAVSARRALVLWFEDLHWADQTTLSAIAYLALRQRPARLLIVCTKLPVEMQSDTHPIKNLRQELRKRGQHFNELRLGPLPVTDVIAQLEREYPGLPPDVGQWVHRHTGGYALFTFKLIEHLLEQRWITREDEHWELHASLQDIDLRVPDTLRDLIEHQFTQLKLHEQQLLEVASVAGTTFDAATLAAALHQTPEQIEFACQTLVRSKKFIRTEDPAQIPGQPLTGQYRFVHLLYHQVIYERVAPFRRAKLHSILDPLLARIKDLPRQERKSKLAEQLKRDADSETKGSGNS